MFLVRTITTIVLGGLVLFAIWTSPLWLFHVLTAAFILLAGYEWSALMSRNTLRVRVVLLTLIVFVFLVSYYLQVVAIIYLAVIGWLLAPLAFFFFSIQRYQQWMQHYLAQGLWAIISLVACWLSLVLLRLYAQPPCLLFILLFSVWCADIAAYLTGNLCGKHKLAPQISPGKTIEGVLGAVITIIVWALFTFYYLSYKIHFTAWLLLLLLVLYISVIGDLFESMLKRQKGVKDSGTILPGHGGMLDRIDALLAAAPVFYLGCLFVLKL